MQRRILIIEDDMMTAKISSLHLERQGFIVEIEPDGQTGLAWALSGDFDLVILDLMLPDLDGLAIIKEIRGKMPALPIIIVSARSGDRDKVRGLDAGADDYLSKPFSFAEMAARVRSLLRRVDVMRQEPGTREEEPEVEHIKFKDWLINTATRTVTRGRFKINLTAREFDLMVHFAKNPGRVFSRAELLDAVWGNDRNVFEHTVNSQVNRLRAKIEKNPATPRVINTVWGVGYKFDA